MAALHLYCKRCSGKIYEDEVYTENNVKKMQLGCYTCSQKLYVDWNKWNWFLFKLNNARR